MRDWISGKWQAAAKLFAVSAALLLAVIPAERGFAFDPHTFVGTGLCSFGTSPFFSDVLTSPTGAELISTNIDERVFADADADGFRVVRLVMTPSLFDRSGNLQWRGDQLTLFSPDLATVFGGGGIVPPTYTFPGFTSSTFGSGLFLGGFNCYAVAHAVEAGGQEYVAVVGGFITQSGMDEASGSDESRVNVLILNASTGDAVFEHKIRPRNGRYLLPLINGGIGDVDDDGNDELVLVWAFPRGNGTYRMAYEVINILTGAVEGTFSHFISHRRAFE